jgi:hypothetical protein
VFDNGLLATELTTDRRSLRDRDLEDGVVEIDNRRWVIGSYGDVNWTRNLRKAGEATIQTGKQPNMSPPDCSTPTKQQHSSGKPSSGTSRRSHGSSASGYPKRYSDTPTSPPRSRPVFELGRA